MCNSKPRLLLLHPCPWWHHGLVGARDAGFDVVLWTLHVFLYFGLVWGFFGVLFFSLLYIKYCLKKEKNKRHRVALNAVFFTCIFCSLKKEKKKKTCRKCGRFLFIDPVLAARGREGAEPKAASMSSPWAAAGRGRWNQ